jgi:hypothetical protein
MSHELVQIAFRLKTDEAVVEQIPTGTELPAIGFHCLSFGGGEAAVGASAEAKHTVARKRPDPHQPSKSRPNHRRHDERLVNDCNQVNQDWLIRPIVFFLKRQTLTILKGLDGHGAGEGERRCPL